METTVPKALIAAALVYGAVAIVTFGRAAVHADCRYSSESRRIGRERDCRGMSGLAAGVAWPLYWSWVAFEAPHPSSSASQVPR